ncbi:uncharacterized protein LOC113147196 [Cyclospora cayetanensis]|uniref:Uncharacterized protein LOC113147196 n=1 Tax=Cyclospora cayetanensis TaxID=88456 RepID=A0A6P6RXV6_9EIME|nr:uncharacterized protein LOC113147196 [Cyclospora cayetanensis]
MHFRILSCLAAGLAIVCTHTVKQAVSIGLRNGMNAHLDASSTVTSELLFKDPMQDGLAVDGITLDQHDSSAFLQMNEEEFGRIDRRMKPCFQSKDGQACGGRVSEADYPGGLHCPAGLCCSKTATQNRSSGNWCSSSWASCWSFFVYTSRYSYGTCKCKRYASRCPEDSTCVDTSYGPYCKCVDGKEEVDGGCHYPTTTSTTTTSTTTTVTTTTLFEEDTESVECRVDDCSPGFCSIAESRIVCTCAGGYTPRRLSPIREECVLID